MARSGGGVEGGSGGLLKKGPWTQAEDKLLVNHVRRHGEGNWNAVRRETGLQRCGKSCRLRWANHLRPNLRKGPFSPEEERQILLLHGLIGNKWARISSHLPGRTDNEIKNYWNTRLRRRQRAGLPLYPPDVGREIAFLRAQNANPFADADANSHAHAHANGSLLPPSPPLLYDAGNPFVALPPTMPSPTASHSPLINQNYPLLNQTQVFHNLGGNQQPAAFHLDGSVAAAFGNGHSGIVPSGLPPLPTAARAQAVELPSNQFDTSSSGSGSGGGGGGLLESMLIGDEHLLLRPNPSMVKVPSMPALSYREPAGSRMLPVHGAGSDGDVTSHAHCPPGEDNHHGATWDFTFESVKPAKRRTASEVGISDMFAIGPTGDWFGTYGGSTAPSPGPSSAVTDDEFNLEMQQFISLLPLSIDEHGWNA